MKYLLIYLLAFIPYLACAQEESVIALKDTVDDDVYIIVDVAPQFKGGDKALKKFYKQKSEYKISKDRSGSTVYFQMTVSKTGSISDLKILSSPDKKLDIEISRLVKLMPVWVAGQKNGKVVNTRITQEVSFIQ